MSDDLTHFEALDKELIAMVDNFANLIKAARIPDEESDQSRDARARDRAPGDLLEVWAEKLVYSGFTALHQISQLKRTALTSDSTLIDKVRSVRDAFGQEETAVHGRLSLLRQEVQSMQGKLEQSYYATHSSNRGQLTEDNTSQVLKDLAKLAMEMPERAGAGAAGGGAPGAGPQ